MLCQMDDVLIFGSDKAQRLTTVLKRLQATGVTLNSEECEFVKIRVKLRDRPGRNLTQPREDFCDCQNDNASQRPQITSFPWDG